MTTTSLNPFCIQSNMSKSKLIENQVLNQLNHCFDLCDVGETSAGEEEYNNSSGGNSNFPFIKNLLDAIRSSML